MDPVVVGAGLGRRLRDLRVALERLDAFAFREDDERGDPGGRDLAEAAREMVLRALRTTSDPVNDRILRLVEPGPAAIGQLAEELTLPRLSVWERVGDLVQVGLAERSLDGDRVALTDAGRGLLELIADLASAAGEASVR